MVPVPDVASVVVGAGGALQGILLGLRTVVCGSRGVFGWVFASLFLFVL